MKCATHPVIETELACATCGKPICPDCLVHTPVGMKCAECGIAPVPAFHRISPSSLALALIIGAAIGAAAGAVALSVLPGYALLLVLSGPPVGALAGEGVSRVASGRRGLVMAIAAAASAAIGFALVAPNVLAVVQGGTAIPVGSLLLELAERPFYLLFVAGAAVGAFWRLR